MPHYTAPEAAPDSTPPATAWRDAVALLARGLGATLAPEPPAAGMDAYRCPGCGCAVDPHPRTLTIPDARTLCGPCIEHGQVAREVARREAHRHATIRRTSGRRKRAAA